MTASLRARLLLLCAAVLFSTGGVAIKATTLNGWQVACFRSALAAAALTALLPAARRGLCRRAAAVALAYAATVLLFVLATKLTTAANAIFLQSAAPLYLLLIGPLLLKEPVRGSDLGVMLLVAAGLLAVLSGQLRAQASAPDPTTGNLLGLLAGASWAATLAGLRSLRPPEFATAPGAARAAGPVLPRDAALAAVILGNLVAAAVALPFALAATDLDTFSLRDVALVSWLGLGQIGLAYACLTAGLRHVPALAASLILLAEPALNPLWTWLLAGEHPGVLALAGGVLILAATLLHARARPAPLPALRE